MATPRAPVGSPVLTHGLNLPDPLSLLARSSLTALGMPRTLSCETPGRRTEMARSSSVSQADEMPSGGCVRKRHLRAKQEIGWSESSAASSVNAFWL